MAHGRLRTQADSQPGCLRFQRKTDRDCSRRRMRRGGQSASRYLPAASSSSARLSHQVRGDYDNESSRAQPRSDEPRTSFPRLMASNQRFRGLPSASSKTAVWSIRADSVSCEWAIPIHDTVDGIQGRGEGASPQGLPDRHKSARWPYDLPAYSWTGASGPSPIRVQETRARSPTARPRPIWEIPADSRCPAGKVNRGRGTPARVGESHRPFGLSVPRVEFLSGR